jgi:hypothetical protein
MPAQERAGRPWATALLLVSLLVVLVMAVPGCSSDEAQQEITGIPSDEVMSWMQDWMEAMDASDRDALTAMYVETAIMDDQIGSPNMRYEGRDEIADYLMQLTEQGIVQHSGGKPLRVGDYVVQPITLSYQGQGDLGQATLMFLVDKDDMIIHQWVTGVFHMSQIQE